MHLLNPTQQMIELRKELTALLKRMANLEADMAYLAMMVGVNLTQEEQNEKDKEPSV